MKRYTAIMSSLLFVLFLCFQGGLQAGNIVWLDNYEQALEKAKNSNKILILFFTGSDWCTWCNKLESEVLITPEFNQIAGDKFVFLKLDFPRESAISAQTREQNRQLQMRFDVHGFPTLVLLDPLQERQIGVTGYRSGVPKEYANHLMKIVSEYINSQQGINGVREGPNTGARLKSLYEKACELDLYEDQQSLISAGIKSDEKHFFQLEQYRLIANEGMIDTSKALILRQELLNADPDNSFGTHYQIAIIDFETYSEDCDNEKATPDTLVSPLVKYIQKFGKQDKENLWRLQMIISQVCLDNNCTDQALNYAQACHDSAPQTVRPEINKAITNIKSKVTQR